MDDEAMWEALFVRIGTDSEYQRCLTRVKELEPVYLRIREMLEPEDQRLLEDYIAACGDLDDCVTVLAYQLGNETR